MEPEESSTDKFEVSQGKILLRPDKAVKENQTLTAATDNALFVDIPSLHQAKTDPLEKRLNAAPTPSLVKLVFWFSGGKVKSEKQANWVLVFFSLICISLTVYIVTTSNAFKPSPLVNLGPTPSSLAAVRG